MKSRILVALAGIILLLIPIHGEVLGGPFFTFLLMGIGGDALTSILSWVLIVVLISLFLGIFIKYKDWIIVLQSAFIFSTVIYIFILMLNDSTSKIKSDTIIVSIVVLVLSIVSVRAFYFRSPK
ncbi:MAG TPA: hypothetical protein VI731_07935 [Bacteroidia bacterium]|nr:hypothetical protein [Bacteroidia bacterium]